MGGIISGFLSGTGKGMAQAGQMLFADKIAKEREEANFLRDSALKKGMKAEEREYQSGEKQLDREAAMERTKYTSDIKAKTASGADKPTSQMKNAASLRKKGYPGEVADAIAHKAYVTLKDEDTGDMITHNPLTGKEVGRLTTVGNKRQWVGAGEEPELAEVTAEHRKTAKKAAGEKAVWYKSESFDFPEAGSRKEWTKKEAQRLAQEERKTKKGIVSGMMKDAETPAKPPAGKKAAPQKAVDAVMADKKLLPQFIEYYGYDPTKQ